MSNLMKTTMIVSLVYLLDIWSGMPAHAAMANQPIHGFLSVDENRPSAEGKTSESQTSSGPTYEAGVLYIDSNRDFCKSLRQLTYSALQRSSEYKKAEKAVDHYSTKVSRSVRFTKDAINYAIPYRGCSMSIEGAQMLLGKKPKLSNLFIAELMRQRISDEMQPKITACVMQIAMALGLKDEERSKSTIDQAMTDLTSMVGQEDSDRVLELLTSWKGQVDIPDSVYQKRTLDMAAYTQMLGEISQKASDTDPIIAALSSKVKKLNHGRLFNMTSSMVESTLSSATLLAVTPAVSVGAEALNTAFVMAIGGPEENKLLKELYISRRLELRRKRISDELNLGLMGYQTGMLTHNSLLIASSEAVLGGLVGPEALAKFLGRDPVLDFRTVEPIELGR